MPSADQATIDAVTTAVEHALIREHGSAAGADDIARAALNAIPDAILEEAPLSALHLDRLDQEYAHFAAPGGMSLALHRGDWVDRGRPSRLHVSILDLGGLLT